MSDPSPVPLNSEATVTASAALITIQLPDGSKRQLPSGSTPLDVATSISPRLAAVVVLARIRSLNDPGDEGVPAIDAATNEETMYAAEPAFIGDRLVDLTQPLYEDVVLSLLKETDPDALKVVRHSAAHVMATAILELFPETKLGHGPATDQGFFYDIFRPVPLTEVDLRRIEERMVEIVARDQPFQHRFEPREQGLLEYERTGEFMKVHFIERFTRPGKRSPCTATVISPTSAAAPTFPPPNGSKPSVSPRRRCLLAGR